MDEDMNDPVILVVDDDPVTRIRVLTELQEFGYETIREAADGLEAKTLLEENPNVDLIITDILMPGLDGIDLLRWGREHVPGPVWILLSGVDTFDAAVEAIRSGAFDFLAKPPSTKDLEVSVRNALQQRRLTQERDRLYGELEDTNKQLLSKVRELEDKSELLRRDLERAEVIQRALLPTAPPAVDRYCIKSVYRPGQYVGGDLYDVIRLDSRHLGIYVADATGHGVTAAMLSVLYKQRLVLVDTETGRPLAPKTVLEGANRALIEAVMAPGLFITAVYCVLDTKEAEITIASAGHPPVLHVAPDGKVRRISRTGPALGLTRDAHFSEERVRLEPDDRLLLYTDGILQSDSALENLQKAASGRASDAEALVDAVMQDGLDEDGETDKEDRDDVTLLVIDVHAGPSRFDNGSTDFLEQTAGPPPQGETVFYGEDDRAHYLALRGRVIWTHCDPLFETASGFLESERPLVLDLSDCEYLDSTCLGTIHELVSQGDVRLQGVRSDVRSFFEELSMDAVLRRIEDGNDLPEMNPLAMSVGTAASGPLRILRAHEALVALNASNREKFNEVVEALRREVGRDRD